MRLTAISVILAALAMFATGGAHAACQVTHGSALDLLVNGASSHNENDCASAATVADHETRIDDLEGVTVSQGNNISALQAENAAQGLTLIDHEGRIVALEDENAAQALAITALQSGHAAQQSEIDALETENADQQAEIDANTAKNDEQDTTLADHDTRITANKNKNDQQDATLVNHDNRITANTNKNIQQDARLDAHDGLLASHGKTLDEHAKGLAITMAMPDAWLGDSKQFGIFGGFGGFNGETAFGFAAIGRLDETWTVNGKLGADTSFDEIGFHVGAGAQW